MNKIEKYFAQKKEWKIGSQFSSSKRHSWI